MLQILFRERYGREPALLPRRPAMEEMLTQADGALIIGDFT
ncbi:MAG: ABC transporter substrate-binding protein, partial [Chloroflexi bacterium]|nr:ABC transporter substrate-binding protein [Chloroflexota bacterium]